MVEETEVNEQLSAEEAQIKKDFPSLELTYEIAIASYDAMVKRFDSMDGRIQTMTAFAVTASLALPTLGKTQGISFCSIWFGMGMALIIIAICVAVFARLTGEIWVLDPANIHKGGMHLPKMVFQAYAIHYAASDFEKNKRLLNYKWTLNVVSMALFALAILSLSVWLMVNQQLVQSPLLRI